MGLTKKQRLNPQEVIGAVISVDGPGSGLDADFLDGQSIDDIAQEARLGMVSEAPADGVLYVRQNEQWMPAPEEEIPDHSALPGRSNAGSHPLSAITGAETAISAAAAAAQAAQNTANSAQNTANTANTAAQQAQTAASNAQATANTASTVANAKANKNLSNVSSADFAAKATAAGIGGGSGGGEDDRLEPFVIGEGVAGTTYSSDTGEEVPIDLAYLTLATKDYGVSMR